MPLLHPGGHIPHQQAGVLVVAVEVTLAGHASRCFLTCQDMPAIAAICSPWANHINSHPCFLSQDIYNLYSTSRLRRGRDESRTSSDGPQ